MVQSPVIDRPVTLVTGAARRIGRAIALELARAGHDVVVHCRELDDAAHTTADELRALGARVAVLDADLADEAACRALVPRAVQAFGRLNHLVNNASLFEHDTVASFTWARMDQHWRANTAAPVALAQALHTHLVSSGTAATASGCVVNLLDQKLWNLNPDHLSYTLSKAALHAATTVLAQALAPAVRVCAVAPGVTLPSGPMNDAEFGAAHGMTPLGRSSTAQDVARAVRFLIESPAITGTALLVDGGQHLQAQARDVLYLAQQNLAQHGLGQSAGLR